MQKEKISFAIPELFFNIHTLSPTAGKHFRGIHAHPAVEIVKVISGKVHCTVGFENFDISEGELLLINRNIGHKLSADDALFTYMQVDILPYIEKVAYEEFPHWGDFILGKNAKAYYKCAQESELCNLWDRITGKYQREDENSKRYIKAYLFELVAIMFSQSLLSADTRISAAELQILSPIIKYIDGNFHMHITLDDICREVGYNKFAVCHTFKKLTGTTVFEYINFVRIRCAAKKLQQSKITILEAAAESGFSSVTYFHRVFKNVMGCSPSVYRRHGRNYAEASDKIAKDIGDEPCSFCCGDKYAPVSKS